MPPVTIKTGVSGPNGAEEILTAYLCDVPNCPNTAVEVLGVVKELAAAFVVCELHALALKKKHSPPLA